MEHPKNVSRLVKHDGIEIETVPFSAEMEGDVGIEENISNPGIGNKGIVGIRDGQNIVSERNRADANVAVARISLLESESSEIGTGIGFQADVDV